MSRRTLRREPRALARAFVCALLAATVCGCAAASRGADPSQPRSESSYPITLAASEERAKAAGDAWARLAGERGVATPPQPEWQPITATLRALPQASGPPLLLPRIGGEEGKAPTDEETREALRRFIAGAAPLLGVVPAELSLIAYDDAGGPLKRATYQQNPFLYPMRGGYGRVEVTFAEDRRVVGLSSTAIPGAEGLRRVLAASFASSKITAERAVASIAGRTLTYADAAGDTQTREVGAQGQTSVRELVVLPVRSKTDAGTLELRVAWEVAVGGGAPLLVYVDAITGEQVAVVQATEGE
ncbi:MAG TPA: hypothetical protein VF240_20440 [Pyrinomonadaceae bacterium]